MCILQFKKLQNSSCCDRIKDSQSKAISFKFLSPIPFLSRKICSHDWRTNYKTHQTLTYSKNGLKAFFHSYQKGFLFFQPSGQYKLIFYQPLAGFKTVNIRQFKKIRLLYLSILSTKKKKFQQFNAKTKLVL